MGLMYGAAVSLGVLLSNTLVPWPAPVAAGFTAVAAGCALGNARAWVLVPLLIAVKVFDKQDL